MLEKHFRWNELASQGRGSFGRPSSTSMLFQVLEILDLVKES